MSLFVSRVRRPVVLSIQFGLIFIITFLGNLSSNDIHTLQEGLALADGVPAVIAPGASRIEAFGVQLGRFVSRFLPLPLTPIAVRCPPWLKIRMKEAVQSLRCHCFMRTSFVLLRNKSHRKKENNGSQGQNNVDR